MIEAHLRPYRPRRRQEPAGDCILELRVDSVEQPVKIGTLPTDLEYQRGVERGNQARQRSDREAVETPPLRTTDGVAREPGSPAKVLLPPSALRPERPHRDRHVGSHAGHDAGG